MKKIFATTILAVATFTMVADSIARPLGGRRSFGRQSTNVTRQAPPATPPTAPGTTATAPTAGAATAPTAGAAAARTTPAAQPARPSPWKGILGGALLGLGLGALFSSLGLSAGLGNAIGSILMILLLVMAVMFVIRMFRRKDTPANRSFEAFNRPTPLHAGAGNTPEIGSGLQPQAFQPVQQPGSTISVGNEATWSVPADFDTETFLRHAKSQFIRMQAAWDKADVADLREFTTPEVFAELKMQIGERTTADYTDVVTIDAQLLGIENMGREWMASVKFNGMMKTAPDAQPEHFAEVWNLTKPTVGEGGWLLAGIQQVN